MDNSGIEKLDDEARALLRELHAVFGFKDGQVLRIVGVITLPLFLKLEDGNRALEYAYEKRWIDSGGRPGTIKATAAGAEISRGQAVDLKAQCNERICIEHVSGKITENVPALITPGTAVIPDATVAISPGDVLVRSLPGGVRDRLIVDEPGFCQAFNGIEAHYQVRWSRNAPVAPSGIPSISVTGPNSRVNIGSVDNSFNSFSEPALPAGLASELSMLREALLARATKSQDYAVIGAISEAESATTMAEVDTALAPLGRLKASALWLLEVARDIGVSVAAEVIKSRI